MKTAKVGFVAKPKAASGIVVMGVGHFKDNLLNCTVFGVLREIAVEVFAPEIYAHKDVAHFAILLAPMKAEAGIEAVVLLVAVEVNGPGPPNIADKGCDIESPVASG